MPPSIKSGRLPFRSCSKAIFTQSTGVPEHDHTSPLGILSRRFKRRGLFAEKAHEGPERGPSGAQTKISAKSYKNETNVLMPLALYPSSLEMRISGRLQFINFIFFCLQKYEKRFINIAFSLKICIFVGKTSIGKE